MKGGRSIFRPESSLVDNVEGGIFRRPSPRNKKYPVLISSPGHCGGRGTKTRVRISIPKGILTQVYRLNHLNTKLCIAGKTG